MENEAELEENSTALPASGRLGRLRDSRALVAWRYTSYRRFFWVNSFSISGRAVQSTVIGFVVYDLTRSDFLLGLVSAMQMAPVLVLAPIVGVIVDRHDRRRILSAQYATQAFGFLVLALLAAGGNLNVPAIAAVVVLMGIASAFSYPAQSALVPSLVPLVAVQSANAISSLVGNVSRILTPSAAGWVIDTAGIAAALTLGTGAFAPAALLILSVPLAAAAAVSLSSTARGTIEPAAPARGFRHEIGEAIAYIRATPLVRAAVLNDVFPYLFGMSYIALLPAIASDTLGGGPRLLGLLFSAGGAGAFFGTLTAGMLTGRGWRGRTLWVAMLGFGLSLLVIAAGQSLAVILPALFLTGYFQMLYAIQSDTLVATVSEERYRGRVLAAQAMVNGLMPIGFLQLGILAEVAGISTAYAVNGTIVILAALATLFFRPVIRDLR